MCAAGISITLRDDQFGPASLIADSVSVNRRHCGTRRRAQNALFWLTLAARRALIAAEGCVHGALGRGPEAEEREVVATASEAGGDPSAIALDIDEFHEVFIS
jgi:hypothetical protein